MSDYIEVRIRKETWEKIRKIAEGKGKPVDETIDLAALMYALLEECGTMWEIDCEKRREYEEETDEEE